jgi:hypothetical protein
MNLQKILLEKYSQENCKAIVQWVGSSQQRFDKLFAVFLHGEYRVTQRAAGALSYCVEKHPVFIEKNYSRLLKYLQKTGLHDSIKRNAVRLLQYVDIPKKYQGDVMNICFQYLENPNEAVAIKAFSLTVLSNLAKQYPEIIPEVKILIEDQMPHQTAAFKLRAKTFLQVNKLVLNSSARQ